jgi:hypothetical protein
MGKFSHLSKYPLTLCVSVIVAFTVFIRPTIDQPLNDDWQYTHVTKVLADTGEIRLDVPIAPSLVLQAYLGSWIIQVFGFSHVTLRYLTIFFSILFLALLIKILKISNIPAATITFFMLLFVLNPIFLNLALSFMTEVYGYIIAFFGVYLWLKGRQFKSEKWFYVSAIVCGLSFWQRQFSVLVFPALLMADFMEQIGRWNIQSFKLYLDNRHRRFQVGLFCLPIFCYFVWAKLTHNMTANFSGPLIGLVIPKVDIWLLHVFADFFYLSLFFAPFLVLLRGKISFDGISKKIKTTFVLCCVIAFCYFVFFGHYPYAPMFRFNKVFPFFANIMNPYGVGVVTVTDTWSSGTGLKYSVGLLIFIQVFLFFLSFRWKNVFELPARSTPQTKFLSNFGLIFVALNFVLILQSGGPTFFDRYYFSTIIGVIFFLAPRFENLGHVHSFKKVVSMVLFCVLGGYSVLGTYDYFRWNETRSELYAEALEKFQLNPFHVDGGYEINGWRAFEKRENRDLDKAVCGGSIFCANAPYAIGWNSRNKGVLSQREVPSLLYPFPPMLLYKR